MANPWDIVPRKPQGDSEPSALFQAVGIALTQWEHLEEVRASLFSELLFSSIGVAGAAFGTIQSSAGRAAMITAAAKVALHGNSLLPRLNSLMNEVEKLAGRRNDIAHGVVREHGAIDAKGNRKTFGCYLTPAAYNTLKRRDFTKVDQEDLISGGMLNLAKYCYTAEQVHQYINHFADYKKRLVELTLEVAEIYRKK